jgi:hypothetical protein
VQQWGPPDSEQSNADAQPTPTVVVRILFYDRARFPENFSRIPGTGRAGGAQAVDPSSGAILGAAVGRDRAVEPVRGPCYKEGAGRRGASGHVPTLQEDQP